MKVKSAQRKNFTKQKKRIIIFVVLIVVTLPLGYYVHTTQRVETKNENSKHESGSPGTKTIQCPEDIYELPNFERVYDVLEQQPFVRDLPKKGSIRLRFYHFAGPCRIWDMSFILTKENVHIGNSNADIDVWIHSDYADQLGEDNLCEIVGLANDNGDFGKSSELGEATFAWRYKGLYSYKGCLRL